jgi:hypothetical protein
LEKNGTIPHSRIAMPFQWVVSFCFSGITPHAGELFGAEVLNDGQATSPVAARFLCSRQNCHLIWAKIMCGPLPSLLIHQDSPSNVHAPVTLVTVPVVFMRIQRGVFWY